MTFQIVLSHDVKVFKRQIYTVFDVIGDIGGLLDGLHALGMIMISLHMSLFGNPLTIFLLSKIFYSKKEKEKRSYAK